MERKNKTKQTKPKKTKQTPPQNRPILRLGKRALAPWGLGTTSRLPCPGILNNRVPPDPFALPVPDPHPATSLFTGRQEGGGSTKAILFVFFSSGFCHRNADTQPPDCGRPGGGLRAFGTLRERGAHSALPGKQLDATKSPVGAGGARRSAPALGSLPPPGSPQAPSPRRGL